MDKHRILSGVAAVTVAAVVMMGTAFGIAPLHLQAQTAQLALDGVEADVERYESEIAVLRDDFERLEILRAQLSDLSVAVPDSDEVPTLLAQLSDLADETGVTILSLSVSRVQDYLPVLEPDQADGTYPRITAENFLSIPVTLVVEGAEDGVLEFVQGLQERDRLFSVTGLSFADAGAEGNRKATITAATFMVKTSDG